MSLPHPGVGGGGATWTERRIRRRQAEEATIKEFDKKLAESDSYLEMLLTQVDKLQTKASASETAESKAHYEGILAKARDMAESIKHAIVLLQIAKNATVPEEAPTVKDFTKFSSEIGIPSPVKRPHEVSSNEIRTGIAEAVECKEEVIKENSQGEDTKNLVPIGLDKSEAATAIEIATKHVTTLKPGKPFAFLLNQ